MIYRATYYELVYPKKYVPGMGYKKKTLGSTYITENRIRGIGIERAVWQGAARLRVTARVNSFILFDAFGRDAGKVWFCGSLD